MVVNPRDGEQSQGGKTGGGDRRVEEEDLSWQPVELLESRSGWWG